MFTHIIQVLKGIFGSFWRFALIFTVTNGARNMAGLLQRAVSRIQEEYLPGFYCIWCANYQLVLVLKTVRSTVKKESFQLPLLNAVSLLCRQSTLRADTGSTCSARTAQPVRLTYSSDVSQTSSLSLGSVTKWLYRYREKIALNMDDKWINLWRVVNPVVKMYSFGGESSKTLQTRDTLVHYQNACIANLSEEMRGDIRIEGPVSGMDLLTTVGEESVVGHMYDVNGTLIVQKILRHLILKDVNKGTVEGLSELS